MNISLPWVAEAYKWLGTAEIPGARHNNAVVRFLQSIAAWVRDDETPWCAGFVGYCLKQAGLPTTGSLMARSYERYGRTLNAFYKGCIVVLHSGNPKKPQGHVGFGIKATRTHVLILGGNQGNKVSLAWFPRSRVTAFVWPEKAPLVPLSVAEADAIVAGKALDRDVSDR